MLHAIDIKPLFVGVVVGFTVIVELFVVNVFVRSKYIIMFTSSPIYSLYDK